MSEPREEEFQVHIAGHFCEDHHPLIWVYRMEGEGLLVTAKLMGSYPEGEDQVVTNLVQRYGYDLQGRDMPTRIIPDIKGMDALRAVLEREVIAHTREAEEWIAQLMLGNFTSALLDSAGGLAGPYL